MKKQFEIWSEGYVENGGRSGARFHGKQEAESFAEACDIFFKDNSSYGFILDRMSGARIRSYWGCRLFDNQADARKSFG